MKRRGGFGTGLSERFGIYKRRKEEEPQGGLYVHAVSVGEVFIALKFIREWRKTHEEPVILSTSTATGHQVVRDAALPGVRALYSPLDGAIWQAREKWSMASSSQPRLYSTEPLR